MESQTQTRIKLDMGKAWSEATRMLASNRELVLVMAGIFFFLPLLVLAQSITGFDWNLGPEPTPEQVEAQILAFFTQSWWAIGLLLIGQLCGTIALLSLLADRRNPTVGDVMRSLPMLLLSAIGAQILISLATQGPSMLADLLPEAAGALLSLVLLPITVYISIKFSLAIAVIVIDRQPNPIKALGRSWRLTKSNSLRIFAFYLAIFFVAFVLGLVIFMVLALALALLDPRSQAIGTSALLALFVAAYGAVGVAVTAAVHRQLSGEKKDFDPKWDEPV